MVYLCFYLFSGISLRKTSERLSSCFIKREKSCINQSGTGYNKSINPKRYLKGKRKKIEEFIIDETLIKIGSELIDMALGCYYRI
jgi:transposase-like protein